MSGKRRAVLGVLLLHPGVTVSIDRLVEAVWWRPPPSAVPNLHTYVATLRRTVAPGLATEDHGYRLPLTDGELDLIAFEEGVRRARRAAGRDDLAAADEAYREAMGLWRGRPAEDAGLSDAIAPRITELTELADAARADWTDVRLGLGGHAELVGELRGFTREHPLREHGWRQLMLALHGAGRHGEALDAYRQARDALVGELGVEPGPELREVHRAILDNDPPPPREQARVTAPPPRQLPAPAGRFVGRDEELRRLDELRAGPERTVLIVGPAGVGKTSLAVRWAHRAAEHFPDGQLYADLRGFDTGRPVTAAGLLPRLLRALGRPAEEIPGELEAQAALYRSRLAGRRVLIVLDNAAGPEDVRWLQPGEPGCLVLVTSRERLGGLVARDGAQRLTLGVLAPDNALELLGQMLGESRTRAEPEAAARLSGLCGRLPLALRVAGARLAERPERSLAGFAEELSDRGRLIALRVDGDDRAAVGAALELSYRALPSATRRMLRLIGPVPLESISVDAGAALLGVPPAEAEEHLDALARVHLLDPIGPDRYVCHVLTAGYAAGRAKEEEHAAACFAALHRLDAYYRHTIVQVARVLGGYVPVAADDAVPSGVTPRTFPDPAAAGAWIDAEWENVEALIGHAARHGAQATAWRMVDALTDVLHHRRAPAEWFRLATVAMAGAERAGDRIGRVAMSLSLGHSRWRMTDLTGALRAYENALAESRAAGWRRGEAAALRASGVALRALGELHEAIERHRRAAEIDRERGDRRGEAGDLNNLASACLSLARLEEAQDHATRALPLCRETGDRNLEAIVQVNLGLILLERDRPVLALPVLDAAQASARTAGSLAGESMALEAAGRAHRVLGAHAEAETAYAEALRLARRIENRGCQVDALTGLAMVRTANGRAGEALELLEEALVLAERTGYRVGEAEVRRAIAQAHAALATAAPLRGR